MLLCGHPHAHCDLHSCIPSGCRFRRDTDDSELSRINTHKTVMLLVRCPAGTRMRAVAGAVAVVVAPKDAQKSLQARLQVAFGTAVAGPCKLADGSTGTSQAALLTAVCEAAVRVMKA